MNKSNQYKLLILICLGTNSMNHSEIHKLLKKLNSILMQCNKSVALRDHNYSIWSNAKFCSENLSLESESAHPRYQVHQFSGKMDDFFDFAIPNLPKKRIWGRNFKLVSLDLESAPSIYHECQFSGKKDFKFSGLNLGVLPNHVRYFSSYNIEGVVQSWVKTEMRWVQVGAWFSNSQ